MAQRIARGGPPTGSVSPIVTAGTGQNPPDASAGTENGHCTGPGAGGVGAAAQDRIEREITLLVRRAQRVQVSVPGVAQHVDKAAYAILGRLYDDGPMRSTTVATLFGLDVSTVSRQVATLHQEGLVHRVTDPADRRAVLIEVSPRGRDVLLTIRAQRRRLIQDLTGDWPEGDQESFATLLQRFNAGVAERLGGAERRGADQPTEPSGD